MGKKRGEPEGKTLNTEHVQNSKKQRRIESKKSKIKAFLEVATANEHDRVQHGKPLKHSLLEMTEGRAEEESSAVEPSRKKRKRDWTDGKVDRGVETIDGNPETTTTTPQLTEEVLKRLKAECIARKKKKMQQPLIFLTDIGTEAQFHPNASITVKPLSTTDIQQLFLKSIYGNVVEFLPKWCRFLRWAKCSHRVIIFVENASANDYRKHLGRMRNTQTVFEMMVEVSGSMKYFDTIIQELLWIGVTCNGNKAIGQEGDGSTKALRSEKPSAQSFDLEANGDCKKKPVTREANVKDKFSRLDLLLSPKQMLRDKYPFAPIVQGEGWMDFEYTKDSYLPVNSNSPLFAIDCEMCITTDGKSELTRVSIVDEKLNVIYDTLVKPDNEISNYLTQFSGITRALLKDVKVRLPEVQKKIREILPEDAILCGQSLNCDMDALKMVHPYVIDTSVIYNLSGIRRHKTSLKLLSKIFLKEEIQSDPNGHDSIEDSKSVMKLVLLKLSKGIDFGDVILYEGDPSDTGTANAIVARKAEEKQKKITLVCRANKARSSQFQAKKSKSETFCVDIIEAVDNEDVMVQTRQRAIENDITIARLKALEGGENAENVFSKLDTQLKHVYDSCAPNALMSVVFGDTTDADNLAAAENGLCMICLKLDAR